MARQGEVVLWLLNAINVTGVMVVPSLTIRRTRAEPVPAFFLMLITVVLWMKLISFWHCNLTLRCAAFMCTTAAPRAWLLSWGLHQPKLQPRGCELIAGLAALYTNC